MSFFIIFFLSFFLRLISLNQSLWLDEAVTAKVGKTFGYFEIVKRFSPFDFHPPLYYLFIKFWTDIFGNSEISLRFPSIIFSLLSGFVVYKIGSLLKNKKFGFWAATFFLFNPLIIYYSQEARMYIIATFLIISSLFFFIKMQKTKFKIQNNNAKFNIDLILFNIFSILSFYTFYGSIFFIASYLIYFLFKRQYRFFIFSTLILAFSFLLISPLIYQQWVNSKVSLTVVRNWSLILGEANFKNLLLIPIKFSIGRISFYPKWLYWITALVWTAFVFIPLLRDFLDIKKNIKNLKLKIILFYFFSFPIFLGFLVSFFTPLLQYFRFIYVIPAMSLLLAEKSYQSDKIGKILFFGFLFWSLLYLFIPFFHREDWKSLSYFLKRNQIKEVYMIPSSSDSLAYYNNQIKVNSLTKLCDRRILLKEKEIYVIPYTAEIYGIEYQRCLKNIGYQLKKEKGFHQITLEEYWQKF